MRLWTIHPKYLDPQGLVALWREGLLARAVLRGETRGYRHHPQLQRFQEVPSPCAAINAYLAAVHAEATARGYSFDRSKLEPAQAIPLLTASDGQLAYEWQHLLEKLARRNPTVHLQWCELETPEPHPLFVVGSGPIAPWERGHPVA